MSLSKKKQKEIEEAVTGTLHMYERLIENPCEETVGEYLSIFCRVCEVRVPCSDCPIRNVHKKEHYMCSLSKENGQKGSKYPIKKAMGEECRCYPTIKKLAKDRYNELLRRLKVNGYAYD